VSRLFSADDEPEEVRETFLMLCEPSEPKSRPRFRSRPLHPEAIEQKFREKARRPVPTAGWHWPTGWLLTIWRPDWTKRRLHYGPHLSYAEVRKDMRKELQAARYEGALLVRKVYEPRRLRT
jgi:hypothetical protein